MRTKQIKPFLAAVGYAAIFGFSFMFTKGALAYVDPFRLMGFRFALAALVMGLLVVLGVAKVAFRGKNLWPLLVVAALQPIAYFIFETLGVSLTTTSQAGMMIALIPVFVALFSAALLKERPTAVQWFFIALSVFGVIFISLFQQTGDGSRGGQGLLLLLGAVLSAAFYNIASRRSSASFRPFEITFVMMWVGALVFNLSAVIIHGRMGDLKTFFAPLTHPSVLTALLYLGVGSSVIAFFLVNYSLSHLPASQSAVFSNFTTVISIVAGVVFRHEPFFWYHAIGALLILAGVWGTNYFSAQQKKQTVA